MSFETLQKSERALDKLLRYCRREEWSGYDPYDGLSIERGLSPALANRVVRTAIIQLNKRSPFNIRRLLGIKKGHNPKGLALAARALVPLRSRSIEGIEDDLRFLIETLVSLRSPGYEEACWGYNFDWQSRAFYAPRGTPNVVCTAYAANALLDYYEATGDRLCYELAASSCRFLLNRLNRTEGASGICFSYTPLDHSRVYNVNLMAAELLARAYAGGGDGEQREAALRAVDYCLNAQREDGSWYYGEARSQRWIDSFHTGFMLVSLKKIREYLGEARWQGALERGYRFYRDRFFLADSTPKYYHDRLYPVDVHSAAQAVITYVEMAELMPDASEMATRCVEWSIDNLQDAAGYFYFQKQRFYTIKIPYMRWSQAWMLYALSTYLTRNQARENV
ncbi:MAG TPA: hypothetical protein VNO14_02885 [Blastocatellia bacterium]|nr:hypothetical protein [Blastocatellia bacterium]